jgi:quinol monooxygenase YgiN
VIVVTEHRAGNEFLTAARELLEVLARAPGFVSGELGRSPDDPRTWLMATRWCDVGSMRRGFGGYEAKIAAAPVMTTSVDRTSAFEVMLEVGENGVVVDGGTDLAEQ